MHKINLCRALPRPHEKENTPHLLVAIVQSPIPQLQGLTHRPHQVPVLPAIYPNPLAILIPPSGEGGWGDCLLEECHRTADAIERWMLAVSEYLRRSEDRNPETS